MLKIKNDVLYQKDYRISDGMSVFEYALANSQEINAADPIAVVSVDNKYMELNLSGAIIYECLEKNEDFQVICSKFVKLFGVTSEKAKESINAFCSKLIEKGVVEEMK
jgi:tyrosine-protein phosphatase YwqE